VNMIQTLIIYQNCCGGCDSRACGYWSLEEYFGTISGGGNEMTSVASSHQVCHAMQPKEIVTRGYSGTTYSTRCWISHDSRWTWKIPLTHCLWLFRADRGNQVCLGALSRCSWSPKWRRTVAYPLRMCKTRGM
jgi:hypothetical protein